MTIEVIVKQQGAPIYNSAYVVRKSRHMVAIDIDMQSKSTFADFSSGHEVSIAAAESSLHLDESKERDAWTTLQVVGMPAGFELFAQGGGRYSISLVYVRRRTSLEWAIDRWKWAVLRTWDKLWIKGEAA